MASIDSTKKVVLATVILIETLDEKGRKRGKTRKWIKRRESRGFFDTIIKELRLEDTVSIYSDSLLAFCFLSFLFFKFFLSINAWNSVSLYSDSLLAEAILNAKILKTKTNNKKMQPKRSIRVRNNIRS